MWPPSASAHSCSHTCASTTYTHPGSHLQDGPDLPLPLFCQFLIQFTPTCWTEREETDRKLTPTKFCPENLFSLLMQPHTRAPGPPTPHLCCSCLLRAPRSQAERNFQKGSMKAQYEPIYTEQKCVWCPIPHPSGMELPPVFTSQENDIVNSGENKK